MRAMGGPEENWKVMEFSRVPKAERDIFGVASSIGPTAVESQPRMGGLVRLTPIAIHRISQRASGFGPR